MTDFVAQMNQPLQDRILDALQRFGPSDPMWLVCHLFNCEHLSKTFWANFHAVLTDIWALHEAGEILLDREDPHAPARLPNQHHARRA